MLLSSLLNYIALLFEFIGVFLIARGFWSITSQDIESASSTYISENVYMARSLIFQKIDGQYGGILLMIGIVFMFSASFVDKAQVAEIFYFVLCSLLSIVIFCVVFEIRQNHLEKLLKKFDTEPKEKFTNEVEEW